MEKRKENFLLKLTFDFHAQINHIMVSDFTMSMNDSNWNVIYFYSWTEKYESDLKLKHC